MTAQIGLVYAVYASAQFSAARRQYPRVDSIDLKLAASLLNHHHHHHSAPKPAGRADEPAEPLPPGAVLTSRWVVIQGQRVSTPGLLAREGSDDPPTAEQLAMMETLLALSRRSSDAIPHAVFQDILRMLQLDCAICELTPYLVAYTASTCRRTREVTEVALLRCVQVARAWLSNPHIQRAKGEVIRRNSPQLLAKFCSLALQVRESPDRRVVYEDDEEDDSAPIPDDSDMEPVRLAAMDVLAVLAALDPQAATHLNQVFAERGVSRQF